MTVGDAKPNAAKLPTSPTTIPTSANQNSGDWKGVAAYLLWTCFCRARLQAMSVLPATAMLTPTAASSPGIFETPMRESVLHTGSGTLRFHRQQN